MSLSFFVDWRNHDYIPVKNAEHFSTSTARRALCYNRRVSPEKEATV
jgi:hypothetical protein